MKFNMTFRLMGMVLNGVVDKEVQDKQTQKKIRSGYREIVQRADDIGAGNTLLGAYALAAWFISMNRNDGLTPEQNCDIMEKGLRSSKIYKMTMGSADSYFSEKHMEARRKWSKETYERKYKNDWLVDVIEKNDDFEFGFDYHECGVCKLCRDEGCPEYAKYLCRLDFMTTDMMGIKLKRTMTLADGDPVCDFRFSRKESC